MAALVLNLGLLLMIGAKLPRWPDAKPDQVFSIRLSLIAGVQSNFSRKYLRGWTIHLEQEGG